MIDDMLAAAVAGNPDGTAVVFGDRRLRYRELHALVTGFGQGLRDHGVAPGDHVLIVLENCPEFVIGYFATARIGATVQAVDPGLADHELRHHIEETGPAVVITGPRHAARLAELCPASCTVVVTGDRAPHPRFDDLVVDGGAPAPGVATTGRAWVTMLSSGSTGAAKRIGRSQANQVAEADNIATSARVTADDVILCPVPLFHALGQFCCMVTAVRAGAALVLLDHDSGQPVVDQLVEAVERHGVTVLAAVPYVFEALSDLPGDRRVDFSSIRLCLSGSNFLRAAVLARFRARFGIPLRQTYGSTETGSVSWDVDPAPTPGSVGRPLSGVTVRVVDEQGRALPVGAVGEIAVRGGAVVAEPRDGNGFYRTGDLGRVDAAGLLYVIGRTRLQIDTGGHKVNPIDVEEVLRQHPSVRDVAVVGLPLRGGGELLAAAVVAPSPALEPLLAHCRTRLADYQVPRRIRFLDELPRTATGKVRRARLSDMLAAAEDRADPTLRARLHAMPPAARPAELTAYLTGRLADILGCAGDRVDPDAALPALGVDSLGALRLRMAVQDDLGLSVDLPELLGRSSTASVARRLAQRLADPPAGTVVVQGPATGEFPLSPNQRSLWHAEQLNPDNAVYVVAFAALVTSPCDAAALHRSFQLLVDRHPVLRTSFPVRDGVPVQRVAEHAPVDFQVVDVPPAWDDTGRAGLEDDAFRAFDLAAAPALRVRLYVGATSGPVLLVAQHHMIADYWSLIVMARELAAILAAESAGRDLYLPAPSHSYTDYGRWADEVMAGPEGRDGLAYWLERLQPPPPPADLPADRPRPVLRRQRGATLRQDLPASTVAALREYAGAQGTTVYAVLLAACHLLLHAHTGNDDSAIAVNTANRRRHEFADVLGYFANPVVHRVRIDVDEPFTALLDTVSTALLAGLEHQFVTIEQVIGKVGAHRDRGRAPLVEVGFGQNKAQDAGLAELGGFLAAGGHRLRLGTVTLESIGLRKPGVVFDLAGAVYESDDAVAIVWEYDRDLFEPTTVARMVDQFARILDTVIRAPGTPPREIGLDGESTLDVASRGTPLPHGLPSVTESIGRQAAASPDSPAVEDGGTVLRRGELQARASAVAAEVDEIVAGSGAPVAVWVSATADLAVAGLGVLQAGACCMALDSTWHADRVRAALAEDAARLLVTTTEHRDRLGALPIPVIVVDAGHHRPQWTDPSVPRPGSPALVLRTAGVEGPSRPVVLDHRVLAAAVSRYRHDTGSAGDVLLSGSLSAGQTLARLLPVLAGGDTAVAVPDGEFAAAVGSGRAWKSVTVTPTELARVLDQLAHTRAAPRVGTLVVSGEVLTARSVRRWREHAAGTRIVHEYGGAELGLCVSAGEVRSETDGVVPVGRPVPGVHRYVLDTTGRRCPVGVPGEICVADDWVSRPLHGVLHEERLVAEPGAPEGRLYRTGDIGRYLPNGDLVVLGRAEATEPRRGYRGDPTRVEEALHAMPAVRLAVVTGNGAETTALVELTEPTTTTQLAVALRGLVPQHLVPDHVVVTDRVPAAGDGKSARTSPSGVPEQVAAPSPEPAGEVETVLAAIWAEVLGHDDIGLDDDYYAIGGDSVMTIRIATKAAEHGIRITRRQMFTHPTIRALATVARVDSRPTVLTRSLSRRRSLPLTPVQRWFFDQDLAEAGHWNQTVMLAVDGPVARESLRAAMAAVADHHRAFRLRYRHGADTWDQVLDPTGEAVGVEERTAHSTDELGRVVADTHAGIDIAAGPVLRMAIVDTGERGVVLVLAAHHLVMDFLSWSIVLDDLGLAYRQHRDGEPVRLPPATTPYDTWARRLRAHADSPEVQAQLPYWTARTEPRHTAEPSCERLTRLVRRSLSGDETKALLGMRNSADGRGPYQAVLAAVVRAVAEETGEPAVRVELEGHGREDLFEDVDLTRTVGWFTALYPVVFDVGPAATPAAALAEVRAALGRVPGGGLGHGLLRYCCSDPAVRERMAAVPRPDVSFNYLGRLGRLLGDSDSNDRLLLRPVPVPAGHDRAAGNARPYRWEFSASVTGEVLTVNLGHANDPVLAERMLDRVLGTLRDLVGEPGNRK